MEFRRNRKGRSGRIHSRRLRVETLEQRRLLAVDVTLMSRAAPPQIGSASGESGFDVSGHGLEAQPVISADGRFAVFVSFAENLVDEIDVVTNGWTTNVYRYDRVTGDVILVSVNADGTGGSDHNSFMPVISADGNVVAFVSAGTNLTSDRLSGVFVRNISAGTTTCVSYQPGNYVTGGASHPALSADGRVVAFQSTSRTLSPLDTDSQLDIYIRNLETGTLAVASVNTTHTGSGNGTSHSPQISDDGSTVVFLSDATNLHPLDSDDGSDLFAFRVATNAVELLSVSADGNASANEFCSIFSVNDDGSHIAFSSGATNLAPLDTDSHTDVFLRDLSAGTTELMTVNADGTGGSNGQYVWSLKISGDGNTVAFATSATNLHALATTGGHRVFARRLSDAATHLVSVNSDGTFVSRDSREIGGISSDGNVIVFVSYDDGLDPADNNEEDDVYVRNMTLQATQLLSRGATAAANDDSHTSALSANGEVVGFESLASNLVENDGNSAADVFIVPIVWESAFVPGDYNQDGRVDAADYSVWRDALGTTGLEPYSGADGDGDRDVDEGDYGVWRANFGRVLVGGGGGAGIGRADGAALLSVESALPPAEPGADGFAQVLGERARLGNQPPTLPEVWWMVERGADGAGGGPSSREKLWRGASAVASAVAEQSLLAWVAERQKTGRGGCQFVDLTAHDDDDGALNDAFGLLGLPELAGF